MTKALKTRPAMQAAIQQRRMIKAILQHMVTRLQQAAQNACVGHVPTRKKQGSWTTGKFRQGLFELLVHSTVAAYQMRRARTNAVLRGCPLECSYDPGMGRQAKIIVAAKIEVLAVVQPYHRSLRRLQAQSAAVQVLSLALGQSGAEAFSKKAHSRIAVPPNQVAGATAVAS
jgi:hypothetical protein